jgi:hypothetical protein
VIIADMAEQAAAFKSINGQVTRMHKLALQAAALAAGDPAPLPSCRPWPRRPASPCCATRRCSTSMKPGETMALGAIAEGLRLYGRETVITALTCVTETENNKPGVLAGPMIKGLCAALAGNDGWREAGGALLRAFDEIDLESELEEAKVTRRPKGDRRLGGAGRAAGMSAPDFLMALGLVLVAAALLWGGLSVLGGARR